MSTVLFSAFNGRDCDKVYLSRVAMDVHFAFVSGCLHSLADWGAMQELAGFD